MSGCGQWSSYLDRLIRLIWSVGTTPKKVNIDTKIICSGWYVFNGSLSCKRGEDGTACVACMQAIHLWRANVRGSPPHALAFPSTESLATQMSLLSGCSFLCEQSTKVGVKQDHVPTDPLNQSLPTHGTQGDRDMVVLLSCLENGCSFSILVEFNAIFMSCVWIVYCCSLKKAL